MTEAKVINPYHPEYDGFYWMKFHDDEANALKRWFENYKVEQYAYFASEYEWLVVKEVEATAKHIKKRFVCEIGRDGNERIRTVIMDHTAPPAPMVFFGAKRKYEPSPPRSVAEMRQEMEWSRLRELEWQYRIRQSRMSVMDFDPSVPVTEIINIPTRRIEVGIDWGRKDRAVMKPVAPPPPRHRRNI